DICVSETPAREGRDLLHRGSELKLVRKLLFVLKEFARRSHQLFLRLIAVLDGGKLHENRTTVDNRLLPAADRDKRVGNTGHLSDLDRRTLKDLRSSAET